MKVRELIELLGTKADWDAEVEIEGIRTGLYDIELSVSRDSFDKKEYVNIQCANAEEEEEVKEVKYSYVIYDYRKGELYINKRTGKAYEIDRLDLAKNFANNTYGEGEELYFEAIDENFIRAKNKGHQLRCEIRRCC